LESALDSYQLPKESDGNGDDELRAFQRRQDRRTASGVSALLRAVESYHPSDRVRARAKMLERRLHHEIGPPPAKTRIASYYLSRRIKKNLEQPSSPTISDPLPRWSYYNTFDARVWVRSGRTARRPTPYRDHGARVAPYLRFVRGDG
jgi:hypothetical protein